MAGISQAESDATRRSPALSAAIDTEHYRRRLVDERERVKEALDYLHEESPRSMEDETQEMQSDDRPATSPRSRKTARSTTRSRKTPSACLTAIDAPCSG